MLWELINVCKLLAFCSWAVWFSYSFLSTTLRGQSNYGLQDVSIPSHQLRSGVCISRCVSHCSHCFLFVNLIILSIILAFVGRLTQEWDQAGFSFLFMIRETGLSLSL